MKRITWLIVGITVIAGLIVIAQYVTPRSQHTLIVVSGTSSSGKSTITNILQQQLGKEWVRIERDSFLSEKAQGYQSDDEALKLLTTVSTAVKKQLKSTNVILDMMFGLDKPVIATDATYDLFFNNLREQKRIISVLVYCPLATVMQHAISRNATTVLLPFVQFLAYYKPKASSADLVVDVLSREPVKQILVDAVNYELTHIPGQQFSPKERNDILAKMWDHDQFAHQFLVHFKLDTLAEVEITPQNPCDLVVNSAMNTPAEISEQIRESLYHQK